MRKRSRADRPEWLGRGCSGPIVSYEVPGEDKKLGECRCGLILIGVARDDLPPDHQGATLAEDTGD